MSNQVKFFASTQTGAPQLTGQEGSLISVLNSCLLNGFNPRAASTITRDGGTSTVTVDAGHGYRDHDIVEISGASPEAYNGAWRIFNCTVNTFQFSIEGEPATPATGTIGVKISPLGWESPFTGENKVVYRSKNVESNRLFLRVDENSIPGGTATNGYLTASATVTMFENMTDVETGTGGTVGFWRKSDAASATEKRWFIIGDEKRFWIITEFYAPHMSAQFFGDILPFKAGDAYATLLCCYSQIGTWTPYGNFHADAISSIGIAAGWPGVSLARSYSQLGGTVLSRFVSTAMSSATMGTSSSGLPFPNAADNGLFVSPILLLEAVGTFIALRGVVPGLFCPLHAVHVVNGVQIVDDVSVNGKNRRLLFLRGSSNLENRIAFDITGSWE
ncbi:MAG: hypothetical protein LBE75_06500 [Burkholderiales bacterium]|nr:hypothetical protein [Burkholderiales bacterium]